MNRPLSNTPFIIRLMQPADLAFAVERTLAEGWVGGDLYTFEGCYQYDPDGCLAAEAGGQPIGVCVATPYIQNGFIGFLIVRPEARGLGVGAALLNRALDYLHSRGAHTVYLDGVVKAIPLYERNGFHKICRKLTFSGTMSGRAHPEVRPMESADLPAVCALDRRAFGDDRTFIIQRRLELYPELCKVMVEEGDLRGFILGRRGEGWISAGPWVVSENGSAPVKLLESFALETRGAEFGLGILEKHTQAVELVQALGFMARENNPWRMSHGDEDSLGASPLCYAVGTAAKG